MLYLCLMRTRQYSFDMDAIMALNRKQLEVVMKANEREVIELYDQNKQLREKIKQMEGEPGRGISAATSAVELTVAAAARSSPRPCSCDCGYDSG